jgi:hypothetical protein
MSSQSIAEWKSQFEALQCLKLRLRCIVQWNLSLRHWLFSLGIISCERSHITYSMIAECGSGSHVSADPIKHSSGQQSLVTMLSIELWHLVQRWRHFQPARKLDTKSIWRWQKAGQDISVGLPSSMLRIHTRQARLDKGGSTGSIFRLHHLQSDIWG